MRLGELLVASELLALEQLEEALRAQVMWGGRLGTNLVELGHITMDVLSTALGRQHGLPAALDAHFARADRELQATLSADVAEKLSAIPLLRAGKRIVIVSDRPLDRRAAGILAEELAIDPERLVPSICAELRLRYQLERCYGIPRDPRFLRVRGTVGTQIPRGVTQPELEAELELEPDGETDGIPIEVDAPLDLVASPVLELEVPDAPVDAPAPHAERRTYLRTLADLLTEHPNEDSVVATVQRLSQRAARRTDSPVAARTFDGAIKAIFAAPDRDRVALRAMAAAEEYLHAANATLLLIVRGEAAVSWLGFCRDGTELPPIAVPLDQPGLVPAVIRRRTATRGGSGDLSTIDYLLLASLGLQHGELVVAPISVGAQVMGLFVVSAATGAVVDGLEEIATITGAAFGRLMREASRLQRLPNRRAD